MGAAQLIGIAASLSLLAGWRLYAVVFAVGAALRFNLLALPAQLGGLDVLANPWVLAVAGLGALAELFADKIALLDSAWDAAHLLIRPVGGALLASAAVSPSDPAWQVASLLLGGSAALFSHSAKAGTRALVNTSPEPFSNVAVSAAEDVGTAGALTLLAAHPGVAVGLALLLLAVAGLALWLSWRLVRRAHGALRRFGRRTGGALRQPGPAGGR